MVSSNPNLTNLYADNILVTAGIENMSLTSGSAEFDLADLKFISEDGNTTINDTDYYSYNELTKILDVNDFAATKGFVRTVPIDNTLEQSEYKNYKLRIGQVDPKDIIDDDDEEEAGRKPDTGAVTNTNNKSEGVSILPIIAVVSVLAYVVGRKYVSRRKINW